MSVSTTVIPRISYSGNGSTTNFSVPFVFIDDADLTVVLTNSSGTDTTLTLGSNYTVSGGGDNPATGTVLLNVAPASGELLTVYRRTPLTQDNDFKPYELVDPEVQEAALDRLTLITQDLKDQINLAVNISPTSELSSLTMPDPSASKVLAWNATGTGLENVDMDTAILDINALTNESSVVVGSDYVPFYDTSAGANRKTLMTNLINVNGYTSLSAVDGAADYVFLYDTSAGAHKKVLTNDLPINISGLTALSTVDSAADYAIVYDASATANKKVLVQDLYAGAPTNATYLTLSASTSLTNERTLTAGSGISFTDGGANSTLTVTLDINSLSTDSSPDVAADYVATYDASASANKKVLLTSFTDMKLLSTSTASGAATVDFTGISSTYSSYLIIISYVTPATDSTYLLFRTSTDNGSTFTSGANTYTSTFSTTGTITSALDNQTAINLSSAIDLDNTKQSGPIMVLITNASSASLSTMVTALGTITDTTTPSTNNTAAGGYRTTAETNNAFRLLMSSGNITGVFKLYGIK